jgi:hypothetical protein
MAQTKTGRLKVTAAWAKMSVAEYLNRKAGGISFCTKCKAWKENVEFGPDKSRTDGVARTCKACRGARHKLTYRPKPKRTEKRVFSAKAIASMSAGQKRSYANGRPGNMRGKKHTLEARIKISRRLRASYQGGRKPASFKDGDAKERLKLRAMPEYRAWRYEVFARDNFTCQDCGDARGGNLHAHHIEPFATHEALRFEVSNGVTLCRDCHDLRHAAADGKRRLKRDGFRTRHWNRFRKPFDPFGKDWESGA